MRPVQIVDVVAVLHGLVAAIGAMPVTRPPCDGPPWARGGPSATNPLRLTTYDARAHSGQIPKTSRTCRVIV